MNSWEKNTWDKVDKEYELFHKRELEELLENSNLAEVNKQAMRDITKHILTAQQLIENNPLASEEDLQYLEDTKAKYQQVKDELS